METNNLVQMDWSIKIINLFECSCMMCASVVDPEAKGMVLVLDYFIFMNGYNKVFHFPILLQHFFTSFGARDRTYMMMFRLWQNALLDKVSLQSPLPAHS